MNFGKYFVIFALAVSVVRADNQTDTVSPVELTGLPYAIELQSADMGSATLPTLQAYAAGTYDGMWVLMAGRTNGLHNFTNDGLVNFPPEYQNTDIWVIDPVTKQSWSRSLNDVSAGITTSVFNALSATATESVQQSDTLYVAGGYLYDSGADNFTTYNTLTAVNLPGVINWVKTGTGSLASSVLQTSNSTLQVTGGNLSLVNGKAVLTFGQDFEGPYTPNANGTYTRQVRTFDIVNTGSSLNIANISASSTDENFRRRDMNIVPIITSPADPSATAIVALSGVFTPTGGAWTVPVEISNDGTPTMADPLLPGTFKQAMNGYNGANLVLYSPSTGENHILILGGISLQTYDGSEFVTDNHLPFTSQGSSIIRDADGNYTQYYLGDIYPDVIDADTGNPLLFGAEAQFFLNPDVALYDGLINFDLLTSRTLLGYVFGGIAAERANGGPTAASNLPFEVWFTPVAVPEPGTTALLVIGAFAFVCLHGRRKVRKIPSA
ncbi:MAG: PEP-CTERM sorting domain-containing protein [Chthoniobacterales bacterium]